MPDTAQPNPLDRIHVPSADSDGPRPRARRGGPTPATPPEVKPRLSFTVTDDGRIDFSSLRQDTRDRLKRCFTDPTAARELGISGASADGGDGAPTLEESAQLAKMAYTVFSQLAMSVALAAGYAPERAAVLAFTEAEKEALADPTARVLVKYVGTFAYMDEALLIGMLIPIVGSKVAMLNRPDHPRLSVVPRDDARAAVPQ